MTTTSPNAADKGHARVPSIVRPGPDPAGPEGWEERRIEKEEAREEEAAANSPQGKSGHHRSSSSGSGSGIKDKLHRVGEKLALVEPKDTNSVRGEAAHQVSIILTPSRRASLQQLASLGLAWAGLGVGPVRGRRLDAPEAVPWNRRLRHGKVGVGTYLRRPQRTNDYAFFLPSDPSLPAQNASTMPE